MWTCFERRVCCNTSTEYKKRKIAIETGIYLTPYFTCQAYFDGEKLLGVGLAKTKDIILSINENTEEIIWNNVVFYIIPYDSIKLIYEYDCLNLKGEDRVILKSDYDPELLKKRFKEIDLDHFTDDL